MSDTNMIGPGEHENSALSALTKGDTADAQVRAILALASAVNRLAAAQEAHIARNVRPPRTDRGIRRGEPSS